MIDGEEHLLCGDFAPVDGRTPHERISDSGAPALLLGAYEGRLEPHAPWHTDRFASHLYRGRVELGEANELLRSEGHAGLELIDNGEIEGGLHAYHLIPATASKLAAVELHMRMRGYAREECVAVGDSLEDMAVAPAVGRCFLVANAPEGAGPNVERTESSHGEGFYEAVVQSLLS